VTTDTFVSQLIRDRRNRKGFTQVDLSERLGVHKNTIIRWEKGHNPPTAPQRRKLAKVLGGQPVEYEWTTADHERHDRLVQIRLKLNATIRRLYADEE
jgi:transcriptional regulator with XRE-family HTH domain